MVIDMYYNVIIRHGDIPFSKLLVGFVNLLEVSGEYLWLFPLDEHFFFELNFIFVGNIANFCS